LCLCVKQGPTLPMVPYRAEYILSSMGLAIYIENAMPIEYGPLIFSILTKLLSAANVLLI